MGKDSGLKCSNCGGGLELSIRSDCMTEKPWSIYLDCRSCPRTYEIARTTQKGMSETDPVDPYKCNDK